MLFYLLINSFKCMKSDRMLVLILITGISLFLSFKNVYAQDISVDSSFYKKALIYTEKVYHDSYGDQSALYNGSKYAQYQFRFKEGHPFFYSAEPAVGEVIYDGIRYDSIMMSYDETKDVLVINDFGNRIQLLNEKIEQFKIFNSNFIRIEKDSSSNELVSSGFYNVLSEGNLTLLKKQVKTVREVIIGSNELIRVIDEKNYYYIKKNERIFLLKSSNDLYKLMGDRKKEVQQFVKENKLKFSNDKQDMLTKATGYFNSLKK